MPGPYFPELIDCLRDTLSKMEQDEEITTPEVQDLKSRVLLLLAELETKKAAKCA